MNRTNLSLGVALSAIEEDSSLRCSRKDNEWMERFITRGGGQDAIATKDLWNEHTKGRSESAGYMNLKPHYIEVNGLDITFGLENLNDTDVLATDWFTL